MRRLRARVATASTVAEKPPDDQQSDDDHNLSHHDDEGSLGAGDILYSPGPPTTAGGTSALAIRLTDWAIHHVTSIASMSRKSGLGKGSHRHHR